MEKSQDLNRLLYLYSETNSNNADVINYWRAEIKNYCLTNNKLSFSLSELVENYTIHGAIPTSLKKLYPLLINNSDQCKTNSSSYNNSNSVHRTNSCNTILYEKKKLDNYNYNNSNNSNIIGNLSNYLVTNTSSTLLSFLSTSSSDTIDYVNLELLEDIEQIIQEEIVSRSTNELLFLLDTSNDSTKHYSLLSYLRSISNNSSTSPNSNCNNSNSSKVVLRYKTKQFLSSMTEADALLLIKYLHQNQSVSISNDNDIVRINKKSSNSNNSTIFNSIFSFLQVEDSEEITEGECARLKLKVSIAKLESKIERLEAKSLEHHNKAISLKVCFLE